MYKEINNKPFLDFCGYWPLFYLLCSRITSLWITNRSNGSADEETKIKCLLLILFPSTTKSELVFLSI